MIGPDVAEEFFRQLAIFSERYLRQSVPRAVAVSPWGDASIGINGAIVHYTADEDLDRVLRWFNDPTLNAKASAHVVIADRTLGSQALLTSDLPLVSALPATVVQCRPPTLGAWHATWANPWAYGIECVGAGELRLRSSDDQQFCTWRPKAKDSPAWTAEWHSAYKAPAQAWGRWWDPFTADQVAAVVAVLRYVKALPRVALQPARVLGHEQVQGVSTKSSKGTPLATDKRDPGPTCPLHGIRAAVFSDRPLEQEAWWNRMRNDVKTVAADRVAMVQRVVAVLSGLAEVSPADIAWDRFRSAVHTLPVKDDGFQPWGKLALWLLGYYVPSIERYGLLSENLSSALDDAEVESVKVFQRLVGLTSDGIPGVDTRWALLERLKDRGIL